MRPMPLSPDNEKGRAAFEAYRRITASPDMITLKWADLSPLQRRGWEAATAAAIGEQWADSAGSISRAHANIAAMRAEK